MWINSTCASDLVIYSIIFLLSLFIGLCHSNTSVKLACVLMFPLTNFIPMRTFTVSKTHIDNHSKMAKKILE